MKFNSVVASLYGVAVGDALGTPVQFLNRSRLDSKPVTTMVGFGTFNKPPGVWSDDTSMTIATVDSILTTGKLDMIDMSKKFVDWYRSENYTADGRSFDIGNATAIAMETLIRKFRTGGLFTPYYNNRVDRNGNGSLMRMAPIMLYLSYNPQPLTTLVKVVGNLSGITHGHEISKIACRLYVLIGMKLMEGEPVNKAIKESYKTLSEISDPEWFSEFKRIPRLSKLKRENISSSGYVVDSLEASLWCVLTSKNFSEAVLKAVNLGYDTDTIGAITGSLAGLVWNDIPMEWIRCLSRRGYLKHMFNDFYEFLEH